jgi:hypothetical protein
MQCAPRSVGRPAPWHLYQHCINVTGTHTTQNNTAGRARGWHRPNAEVAAFSRPHSGALIFAWFWVHGFRPRLASRPPPVATHQSPPAGASSWHRPVKHGRKRPWHLRTIGMIYRARQRRTATASADSLSSEAFGEGGCRRLVRRTATANNNSRVGTVRQAHGKQDPPLRMTNSNGVRRRCWRLVRQKKTRRGMPAVPLVTCCVCRAAMCCAVPFLTA